MPSTPNPTQGAKAAHQEAALPLPCPKEEIEQECLFRWAALQSGAYPALRKLYHIPNGGKRSKAEAARFKAQGVKPGIPDIHLPVARGGYHCLYIEPKRRDGGKLSPQQQACIEELRAEGNRVEICKGWEEAKQVILEYLEVEHEHR